MDELKLLASALGLAAFAGINLYLTVFVVSLALNMGWLDLGPEYASLDVLAHPAILIIAGAFYFLEFFADKVPWVDTFWDTVHTAIRPLGAALLGITILGETHPVGEIVAALLCGSVALSTHLTKAGTRLIVNASPEPFSNSIASVAEDLLVIGGLAFVYHYPWISGFLALGFIALFVYLAPKFYRHGLALLCLTIGKIKSLVRKDTRVPDLLIIDMKDRERDRIPKYLAQGEELLWGVQVFAGRGCGVPLQQPGHLIGVKGSTPKIGWLAKGKEPRWALLTDARPVRKERFLYDEIEFSDRSQVVQFRVRLAKDQSGVTERIVQECRAPQETPGVATALSH
jgi:hypothetical protein